MRPSRSSNRAPGCFGVSVAHPCRHGGTPTAGRCRLTAFTPYLLATLACLGLAALGGCAQCGDAIVCPSPASIDFPANAVPVVRLHGDSVWFEAPPSLHRFRHYALDKAYVYELMSDRVIWQIDSKTKAMKVSEMAKFDLQKPLVYAELVEGTALTVPAGALRTGTDYNMRADLIGYDQPSVLSSEHVKVTFRLTRENGQLRVEQLTTRRAN